MKKLKNKKSLYTWKIIGFIGRTTWEIGQPFFDFQQAWEANPFLVSFSMLRSSVLVGSKLVESEKFCEWSSEGHRQPS